MPRKNVKVHMICDLSVLECPKVTHIKQTAWSNASVEKTEVKDNVL